MQIPPVDACELQNIHWEATEIIAEFHGFECHIAETALTGGEDFEAHWRRFYSLIVATKHGSEPHDFDPTPLYRTHATLWAVGAWGPLERRLRSGPY